MVNYSTQLIGAATVILKYGDLTIITDPALDPAGGNYDMGFAILEKTGSPVLAPSDLPEIDLVLLSHDQHADNLDNAGREVVANAPLTLTTEEGAERLWGNAVGLAFWQTYQIGDVTITAAPSQHGPEKALPFIGPTIGFIISSKTGPTIYISGDTVPFSGTDKIVEKYAGKIDYALFHTGSVAQGEDELTYFTMTATEAVDMAARLNVKEFSIIHADSWAHFREPMVAALDIAQSSPIAERLIDLTDAQEIKFFAN